MPRAAYVSLTGALMEAGLAPGAGPASSLAGGEHG
jgi:hypothetical protein